MLAITEEAKTDYKIYPRKVLARSPKVLVIALDEHRVAKMLMDTNSYERLESESKKMLFANKVNDLVAKFIELAKDEEENNLLIMERLYPLEYRALDVETRNRYFEEFELKLRQLHEAGLVFRDFQASVIMGYTNYMLTSTGIHLIDTGMSLLKEDIGNSKFEMFVRQEIATVKKIKSIILSPEIGFLDITK